MGRFSNLVAIPLLLPAVSVLAQPSAPADTANAMYERGVNSYFDGNLSRAQMYLHRAVELRPTDPRPHYFLALTLLRQGRTEEAKATIQQGVAVEETGGRGASVGHALLRVQGGERIQFERIRKAARTNSRSIADENARRRQEQFDRRQQIVLRKPIHLPLEALITPVEPDQVAKMLMDRTGPTSLAEIEEATTEEPVTDETEVLAAADEGDPFADDPITTTSTEAGTLPPAGGGVKASSLLGIFGRILKRQLPSVDTEGIRDMVPTDMMPGVGGGPPPGMPEGFGPEGFGPGEFGPMEAGGEEDPFGTDASPFGPEKPGEDSTPSSSEMEEDPFDF